jgi:GT2 family glycosyltransferase
MTTGVVVVSYRPGDWLAAALRSVAGEADEVVLVDNGSEGGDAGRSGREAGARVVRSDVNRGFAGGVNLGVRHLTTDVVALLNDDAAAHPGWLASAAAILADPQVAAVTPKVLFAGWFREVWFRDEGWSAPGDARVLGRRLTRATVGGADVLGALRGPGVHALEWAPGAEPARWRWTRPGHPVYVPVPDAGVEVDFDGDASFGPVRRLVNKAGSLLDSDGRLSDRGEGEADDGRWEVPVEHFFASGTAVAVRRETLAAVGGLAEPLFAYYEDADWSWRARLAGLKIVYDPAAVVDHHQSLTSGGGTSPWVRRLARANHVLCLVRNAPASVAAGAVSRLLGESRSDGARRSLATRLPWAVATRLQAGGRLPVSRRQVWETWAGADPVPFTGP